MSASWMNYRLSLDEYLKSATVAKKTSDLILFIRLTLNNYAEGKWSILPQGLSSVPIYALHDALG